LAVHGLAAALALWLGGAPAVQRSERALHTIVIAPLPPRRAPTEPAHGAAVRPANASRAAPAAQLAPPAPAASAPVIAAKVPPSAPALPPPSQPVADTVRAALDGYAQRLWQHIAAHRPRGAGMIGTPVIRFRVTAAGALLSAEIASSSGNLTLDRIALRAVRQSAPMPPPPSGLTGDQLTFTIPVAFR
jgi:protein TonB